MSSKFLEHDFPAIKGYPVIITQDDINRFEYFLSGEEISTDDIGKYAWITTDGHHRTLSALNAGLPYLETKLDTVYLGDENDYTE